MHPIFELPNSALISWQHLLDILVKAIYADIPEANGIEAVIGKLVPNEKLGFSIQSELSNGDLQALEAILVDTSKLHGRMTDQEIDKFLQSYRKMDNRLDWEPVLFSESSRLKVRDDQMTAKLDHLDRLQQAVKTGQIRAVNINYAPAHILTIGIYIPRDDARKYIIQSGIDIAAEVQVSKGDCHNPEIAIPSESVQVKSPDTCSTEPVLQKKQRGDSLARAIDEAVKIGTPLDVHSLWPLFVDKARAKEYPFVSFHDETIKYLKMVGGKPIPFSNKSLRSRVDKLKKKLKVGAENVLPKEPFNA